MKRQCFYQQRPWDFMPNTVYPREMSFEDITRSKLFWESLEREFKEKNKPKEEHHHKANYWRIWLLLGLFSPIIGPLFALASIESVLAVMKVLRASVQ